MLPEKISYEYDFPINITIAEVSEYPLHYHQDIEILVVLQGEVTLKNGSCTYTLPEGSIFVNNGREVHGIYKTESTNTVALIQLQNSYFLQHFPELSYSSYRTFTPNESDLRFALLRELVLGMLSIYLRKGINYKQECIEGTIQIIKFLDDNFNLFTFENGLVVSPSYGDLLLIQRMSRIIPYIYQHHNEKLTLEDIADVEHLSTYYVSHMIKSAIGMNFRDFLCFARVEFSEMDLLESDSKIHAVAKKVGFSTTAYYEKFFTMWFGEAPEEHKHKYLPMVKSPFRPSRLNQVGVAPALSMVQRNMPAMKRTSYETHVKHLKLFININSKTPTLTTLHPASEVTMSCRDYEKLGTEVFNILKNLNCSKVYIENSPGEADAEPLRIALEKRGYPVEVKPNTHLNYATVYGLDSIANMIHILQNNLLQPGPVPIKLMDSGSEDIMLKGERGIITSSGIYKPSYYAHLILGILKGDLIFHDNHYSVIRIGEERTSYVIIAMNYSNSVDRVCTSSYSLHEVRDILNDYKDELDIDINILDLHGKFAIKKYSFSATGNIFGFMSKLGFPNSYTSPVETSLNFQTVPETDVFVEEIDSSLHLNYSIVGTGLQVTIIESLL